MRTHDLKIHPPQYEDLLRNGKGSEIRVNDRDFQVGDLVRLWEHIQGQGWYTGRAAWFIISHIQEGFGLKPGHVALSWRSIAFDNTMGFVEGLWSKVGVSDEVKRKISALIQKEIEEKTKKDA